MPGCRPADDKVADCRAGGPIPGRAEVLATMDEQEPGCVLPDWRRRGAGQLAACVGLWQRAGGPVRAVIWQYGGKGG